MALTLNKTGGPPSAFSVPFCTCTQVTGRYPMRHIKKALSYSIAGSLGLSVIASLQGSRPGPRPGRVSSGFACQPGRCRRAALFPRPRTDRKRPGYLQAGGETPDQRTNARHPAHRRTAASAFFPRPNCKQSRRSRGGPRRGGHLAPYRGSVHARRGAVARRGPAGRGRRLTGRRHAREPPGLQPQFPTHPEQLRRRSAHCDHLATGEQPDSAKSKPRSGFFGSSSGSSSSSSYDLSAVEPWSKP